MKKDEILKLSELSEADQISWLSENGILLGSGLYTKAGLNALESLADCAFRLRDDIDIAYELTQCLDYQTQIWQQEIGTETYPDSPEMLAELWNFWAMDATPINWIQAALLAREER